MTTGSRRGLAILGVLGILVVAAVMLRRSSSDSLQPAAPAASNTGPDYGSVDFASAEEMVRKGTLRKILLLPKRFGGQDVPRNVVFVPPFAADAKDHIDIDVIPPLIAQGKVEQYEAIPKYQGKSVVPSAIVILATRPTTFRAVVKIWGEGLRLD